MLTEKQITNILNNFDDEVMKILRTYKGWTEYNLDYQNYTLLGTSIYKFTFYYYYKDDNKKDRTLQVNVCINKLSFKESWIDQKAKITPTMSEELKLKMRLAYIVFCIWLQIHKFLDINDTTGNRDKIVNSKSNRMRVIVFPHGRFNTNNMLFEIYD